VFDRQTSQTTISAVSIEQRLAMFTELLNEVQNYFNSNQPNTVPQQVIDRVNTLSDFLPQISKTVQSMDGEMRSLRSLAEIGRVVNSSLDLDKVLQIVMDTIIQITGAERGFIVLRNEENGELTTRIARNWEQESLDQSEFAVSSTVIKRVINDGQPVLTTNAREDPRFGGQQSVVLFNLRSILCVPLKLKNDLIGVVYADNRFRSGLFSQRHLELLKAFSNQAAVAIDNARLFASVRRSLAEVTHLKNLMDSVFFSIASGVLTTDIQERIVLCNRAAEIILGKTNQEVIGHSLEDFLAAFAVSLEPYMQDVLVKDQTVVGLEMNPDLPQRGNVDLRLSLSPLKDVQQNTQGVAIVMEDLTEKKRLEAQRRLFERMVAPAVIDQLNPNSLQLGGNRMEITTLFADIRGFTRFSESLSPEDLVKVLNRYLAVSADAVLREEGTIDKFLGDALMAWFNAPIPQPDHTLRAVRAALGMRDAIQALHREMPLEYHLHFGAGIHLGDAVLGLIGTEKRLDYTAIGDSVNTAKRIQENASPGQILISQPAYERVADRIQVRTVDPILAKGKREPVAVYEVLEIG
jgi:PAS domain S-box-containing protein